MFSKDRDAVRAGTPHVCLVQPGDVDIEAAVLDHRSSQPLGVERVADLDGASSVDRLALGARDLVGFDPFTQVAFEAGRCHPQDVAWHEHRVSREPIRIRIEESPGRSAQEPVCRLAVRGQELRGGTTGAVSSQCRLALDHSNLTAALRQGERSRYSGDAAADDDRIE